MRQYKISAIAKFGLMIAFSFLGGCSQNPGSKDLKFSGTLELTEYSIGAKAAGRLTSVLVDEGDTVRQGQLIAMLDRYEQTKKDYARTEQLVRQGGATEQSLEYARLAMEDEQVVSPVDGIVLVKIREAAETVAAGNPVVVIGDRSKLWVRVYIPQGFINRVRVDQAVDIAFDGLKETFPGHVSMISPRAEFTPRNVQTSEERVTQTFAVKVVVENPPEYLRPGVAADVFLKMND